MVDVRAHFARKLPFLAIALHAHDDAFAIHRIHHAGALADDDRAGIARGDALHAGAHKRSLGAQQRNRLALHVRTHERAVGVVVFKERNQAGGHETSCLGLTSMYWISPTCLSTKLPAWRALTSSAVILPFSSKRHVGLGDDVLVFFPSGEIVAVRLEFGGLLLAPHVAVGLVDLPAA